MKKLLLFGAIALSLNSFGQTNTSSISFDGVDDQVICNNPLENNMSDFTIMFFANFPQLAANIGDGALITNWPAGGATFKIDQWNNNGNNVLRMNLNTSGGSYQLLHSLTNGDYNTWINWSFNFTGSSLLLYKNGVLVETTVGPQGTVSPSGSSILFGQEENNSAYYTGLLDEIHIWNVVLTEQQIQDYMQCPPTGNETGLIGYWNFEEGSGTNTTDQTSNGNNGILNGGVSWSTDVPPYNCCTPDPITSQPTDQSENIGSNATFSFTDTLIGATYQWQIDAGTGYNNLSNAGQFSGTDTETLNVSSVTMGNNNTVYRCIVTESSNCQDTTDAATLTVIDNTGIDEIESLISVHPNPTIDEVTLSVKADLVGTGFTITDNAGRIVLSETFKSTEQKVNLSGFDNGVYFIRTDKESQPVKIIKQ